MRVGNESQEPMVVYVLSYKTDLKLFTCAKINSGQMLFASKKSLIDFDYNKYLVLYYEWMVKNQDVIKKRYKELLRQELNKQK